ncbi:MAG: 5'/3'-nucleotidase SurE [Hyphomicrobiales bacterium]|nr:5'/3'-nucleotidase SurE [Hyphomicrobiales bacterium]
MRILITNDDGIHAPGLTALENIARALSDDVWVVAPETDQSGAAHSLSLNDPLRIRAIAERHHAVRGTPTDCVIMAVRQIIPGPRPDLVLSGVNRGSNVADDVTYSGTVAGAVEGALLGIPSMALSQTYQFGSAEAPWQTAETLAPDLVRRLYERGFPGNVYLNINFPNLAPNEVRGTAITRQGKRDPDLMKIAERKDGRGNPYYWIAFERKRSQPDEGTDLWAIYEGLVSVTPLSVDLTDKESCDRLSAVLEQKPG